MGSHADLERLLFKITVPNNAEIKASVATLKKFLRSHSCVEPLLIQIKESRKDDVRVAAAIYLRDKITKHWKKLNKPSQIQTKSLLLQLIQSEKSKKVRLALVGLISRVASQTLSAGEWEELFPFLEQCSNSQDPIHREIALKVLGRLIEDLGPVLAPHFNVLLNLFGTSLDDQKSPEVRLEALRACGSLLSLAKEDEEIRVMQGLIPYVIKVVLAAFESGDTVSAEYGFELFDSFMACAVPILDPFAEMLLSFMLQILINKTIDLSIRERANHFLRWMCEYQPKKVLKHGYVPKLLQASIGLQFEPYDIEELKGESNPEMNGSMLLGTLVEFFDDKLVYLPAVQAASQLVTASDECQRKAGFNMLYVLSDSYRDVLSDNLEDFLKCIFAGMKDPNSVLVRTYACRTLGEFAFQHPSINLNQFHSNVIEAIFDVLDRRNEDPAVQERACAILEVFCANMAEDILPYLSPVMEKLFMMFRMEERPDSAVQMKSTAIASIGSVAVSVKEKFLPYFQDVIVVLTKLIQCKDDDDLELRGRALSCVGSVARAVGWQVFEPLFPEFMRLALAGLELEDPSLKEQTYVYFQDLAQLLGEDFAKCEDMPSILISLASSIMSADLVQIRSDDDPQDTDDTILFDEESDDEEDIIVEGENVLCQVRNSFTDEKATAITTIGVFAKFIGKPFFALGAECFNLLKHCEDHALPLIRQSVICAYDEILKMVFKCFPFVNGELDSRVAPLVDDLCSFFIGKFEDESDKDNVVMALEYFGEAITDFGPVVLNNHVQTLSDALILILNGSADCHGCAADRLNDDDVDAGVHSKLMDSALDLAVMVVSAWGRNYVPLLNDLLVPIVAYFHSSKSPNVRAPVVIFFAEIAEPLGDLLKPYLKDILSLFFEGLESEDKQLVHNSCFALGCFYQHLSVKLMIDSYERVCQLLHPVLVIPDNSDMVIARDNAVSCVCKMIMRCPQALPLDQVLPLILNGLPLVSDMEENEFVYECIFGLWQQQTNLMIQHIERILFIIAAALASPGVQDECKMKIVQFTRILFQSHAQQLKPLIDSMSIQQQEILQRCFQ
uniref:Importin-4 isoform X1 n=1 Tax=Hirondellea gigas TaxID=1518452 RepID=A0A6A7G7Q6_9CRUS